MSVGTDEKPVVVRIGAVALPGDLAISIRSKRYRDLRPREWQQPVEPAKPLRR